MMMIDLRGANESLKSIIDKYSVDLAREIIFGIFQAVDEGIDQINCLVVFNDTLQFCFTASKSFYAVTLRKNMEVMVEHEEYEICAQIMKYLDRLEPKLLPEAQ